MPPYESLNAQCFVSRKYRPLFTSDHLPELLYACHIREDFSNKHPRIMHSHKDLAEIVLIYQGAGNYMIRNRKYNVKKGDLLVYNAGVVHDENPAPGSRLAFYTIGLGSLQLPGLPENTLVSPECGVQFETGESYGDMLALFRMIFDNLSEDAPDAERFCNDLLLAVISRILTISEETERARKLKEAFAEKNRAEARKLAKELEKSSNSVREASAGQEEIGKEAGTGPEDPSNPLFDSPGVLTERVMQYIDLNYMNPITIQEIADALYASPYYIAHVFKKETGYSPIQYMLRRRIGEAQTLLITSEVPIVDIAGIVGYDTQSYFTSQFTRYVGMPPRQYRLKYRK